MRDFQEQCQFVFRATVRLSLFSLFLNIQTAALNFVVVVVGFSFQRSASFYDNPVKTTRFP